MKSKELLSVLSKIKPGIAKADTEEQSTHFIFMKDSVVTYNDKICISHDFPIGTTGSVKADDFFKVVSSIEEEDFEISQKEDSIFIESESTKAELPFLTETNVIKKIETLNTKTLESRLKSLPEDFIAGVSLCLFSAQKDDIANSYLHCINIQEDHILSSDNYRISYYELSDKMEDIFLIPLSEAIELCKFNFNCYSLDESWIHFTNEDGIIFSARRASVEYKGNYEGHFEVKGVEIELPSDLKKSVDLLGSICATDFELDKEIQIKIDKKKMILKVQKEKGWIEKSVTLEKPVKKKVNFNIHPTFFSQILTKSTTMTVGDNTALFTRENFKHVVGL